MAKERLSKALASSGIASRRASEKLIFSGSVSVNGQIVTLPQTMVDLSSDNITVNNIPVHKPEPKVYYILNKPPGFVCSNTRRKNGKIVLDLFPKSQERLFTVGRLDKNTTGLIIVTNDGYFANEIIHPSSSIQKEYLAKTSQEISPQHLQKINAGTYIEGSFVKPIKVKKIRRGTIKITITDGKKHEVRVLLRNAGLTIKELSRIRIGNLRLGSLPLGHWRKINIGKNQDPQVLLLTCLGNQCL